MRLLIMRHGDAVLNKFNDEFRPLSVSGCFDVRKIARCLHDKVLSIDKVLISPYLRTLQTLEILREVLVLPKEDIFEKLAPDGDFDLVFQDLQMIEKKGIKSIFLISHLPIIRCMLVEFLQEPMMDFSTSNVICVDYSFIEDAGKILWKIDPSTLF